MAALAAQPMTEAKASEESGALRFEPIN